MLYPGVSISTHSFLRASATSFVRFSMESTAENVMAGVASELKSCWALLTNVLTNVLADVLTDVLTDVQTETSLTGRCALAAIASLAKLVVFPLPVGPTTAATAPLDPFTPRRG